MSKQMYSNYKNREKKIRNISIPFDNIASVHVLLQGDPWSIHAYRMWRVFFRYIYGMFYATILSFDACIAHLS